VGVGRLLAIRHRNAELYTYIAESLKQFPDSPQLKGHLEEIGFRNISSKKHFLGMTETIIFTEV
jgi:ubiquinone/menaquinone biosynthesis C-methylase UbiE